MNFYDYLKDKFVLIILYVLTTISLIVLLNLFNTHILLIIYIPTIFFALGLVMLLLSYFKKRGFYKELDKELNNLDKKYLISEIIEQPNFLEGKKLYEYIYEIDKSMIENINIYKNSNIEFKEYIELWCHEIKTPISTTKLIIENNKNKITDSISEEINKINNYVEQVLYYARSENVEKDYIIKKVNIKKVIESVIKHNKKDLLSKKIEISIFSDDVIVNSDDKWLEFIINQIVINSIKYSNENPKISFDVVKNKDSVILYINDNGIGISDSEIDKVFDKGFTGTNGRKKYNSTGFGLYLCQKLCKKLGHNILINSTINESTTVSIVFPLNSLIKSVN